MTYEETLDYLYHVAPAFERVGAGAYKAGLTNTYALDEHFHHPHKNYLTIHIAGTNGKGSTAHTLAAILQAEGYKVGLYTSPHLVDFSERIRVNGVAIPPERVVTFVETERQFFAPLQPSFFELTTALAFLYFSEEQVDIAVIEVGLGGRLDCTNIITPILSVITNISLDHTQLLGDSLAKIAYEKAGIMKSGVPCVIGELCDESETVFRQVAKERNSPLIIAQHHDEMAEVFALTGDYQQRNKDTILSAVDVLRERMTISDEAIRYGLRHVVALTGLRGRWQTLATAPLTICDTGHNVAAWQWLAPQIARTAQHYLPPTGVLRIIFGMVDDKDVATVLAMLPPTAVYYFCQASTKRAIPAEELLSMAAASGLTGRAFSSVAEASDLPGQAVPQELNGRAFSSVPSSSDLHRRAFTSVAEGQELNGRAFSTVAKGQELNGRAFSSVAEAYAQARHEASNHDLLFIGGSSYVVADLLTDINH